MSHTRIVLTGGAAAIVLAGALHLFPPFSDSGPATNVDGKQFGQAVDAFTRAVSSNDGTISALEPFGLIASRVDGADDAILLSEPAEDCSGKGVYWINQAQANALAITAPHRGSDRHTGTLAAALFMETNARAAAWNSSPRRSLQACANAIDLARTKDHLFSAFNLGFAEAIPGGLIVQLHGFDGAKREGFATQEAAMILSNGTRQPSERLLRLADDLSLAFAPLEVLVFPIGSKELGATKNAQAQMLRDEGFGGFVHIEISAPMREVLVEDGEQRARLAQALVRASQ